MSATNRHFTGEFEHTIDSVNRLVIPAKWRLGQSEEFFVFARDEGRLAVLTQGEVDKMLTEIHSAPGVSASEKRDQSQTLFSSGVQLTCDKQGRITMDSKLMKHAGLKGSVVLVGGGFRFEMWDPKAWERRKAELTTKRNAVMDHFGI
jgi:MraZ protein